MLQPTGHKLGILTGLKAEANLVKGLGIIVPAGGTREAARLAQFPGCTALLSFGLAGGLDPTLPPGALVIPRSVIVDGRSIACDPSLLAWLGGANVESLIDAPEIIATVEAKAKLFHACGAAAVDLESGEVARRGLPFAALRAVCDPANEDLPPAALLGLTSTGGINIIGVAGSLLRQPRQLGALLRLARHATAARRSLQVAIAALKNG